VPRPIQISLVLLLSSQALRIVEISSKRSHAANIHAVSTQVVTVTLVYFHSNARAAREAVLPQVRHISTAARSVCPQAKKLGFPWIPLAESGLFNGLRRIQIKIFSPFAYVAAQLALRLSGRIARLGKASMNFVFRK
jgi:hypothetical protein